MEPLREFSRGHIFLDLISVISSGRTGGVGMWVLKGQLGNEWSGCGQDICKFRLNVSCWRLWLGTDTFPKLVASLPTFGASLDVS